MQDHYETLQVHPKADQETIQAAYERLQQRYAALQLQGAADELVERARRKRDDIERAYAVLNDPIRRASYDAERQVLSSTVSYDTREPGQNDQGANEELLDYRPLPPAYHQERPSGFNPQPTLSLEQQRPAQQQSGRRVGKHKARPAWFGSAVTVATVTFVVMLTSLLLTGGGRMHYANDTSAIQQPSSPQNAAQSHAQLISQYEDQVIAARQVVEQLPESPSAWVRLGNALYDSVQVVREVQPDSPEYTQQLPRWIEASEAYSKALELGADDKLVRSDMGVSLCYYGAGMSDITYVNRGLSHAQRAAEESVRDDASYLQILLNLGICLVNTQPPRTDEAVKVWREIVDLSPTETSLTQQAQQLVNQYSK